MPIQSVPPALLTVNQSCEYLGGKSRDHLYRLIYDHKVDSILLSPRARRVTKSSLDRYISSLVEQARDDGDQAHGTD